MSTSHVAEILLTSEQIQARISELAQQIEREHPATDPIHRLRPQGGFLFLSDLVRGMGERVTLDFIAVSSYGKGTTSSGEVRMLKDLDAGIEGRDVVIVEDIVDTGLTLTYLQEILRARNPRSLRTTCSSRNPRAAFVDVKVEDVGLRDPDKFVVGYGLDYAERYRNLPYIGACGAGLWAEELPRSARCARRSRAGAALRVQAQTRVLRAAAAARSRASRAGSSPSAARGGGDAGPRFAYRLKPECCARRSCAGPRFAHRLKPECCARRELRGPRLRVQAQTRALRAAAAARGRASRRLKPERCARRELRAALTGSNPSAARGGDAGPRCGPPPPRARAYRLKPERCARRRRRGAALRARLKPECCARAGAARAASRRLEPAREPRFQAIPGFEPACEPRFQAIPLSGSSLHVSAGSQRSPGLSLHVSSGSRRSPG